MKLSRADEKTFVDLLVVLLRSPEVWQLDGYYLYISPPLLNPSIEPVPGEPAELAHLRLITALYCQERFSFWVANGFSFLRLEKPENIKFRFMQRLRLWFYVRLTMKAIRNRNSQGKLKKIVAGLEKLNQTPPDPTPTTVDYGDLLEDTIEYQPGRWAS